MNYNNWCKKRNGQLNKAKNQSRFLMMGLGLVLMTVLPHCPTDSNPSGSGGGAGTEPAANETLDALNELGPGAPIDLDNDGVTDGMLMDENEDGEIDSLDLNNDGTVDLFIVNQGGVLSLSQDTAPGAVFIFYNDGSFTLNSASDNSGNQVNFVDSDEDGVADGFDLDGDGASDEAITLGDDEGSDNEAPTTDISISGGIFYTTQSPMISCNDNTLCSELSYTLDGSDPDFNGNGTIVDTGESVSILFGSTTIKFVAIDSAGNISNIQTEEFEITGGNCKAILDGDSSAATGIYTIDIDGSGSTAAFDVYCDMDTDGGGWTLVWSVLKDFTNHVTENMNWSDATTTLPQFNGTLNTDLESFEVYTGLDVWIAAFETNEMRYSWANDFGSAIDQSVICTIGLDDSNNYTLSLSSCSQTIGATAAGITTFHDGQEFSTYEQDNDSWAANNCSTYTSSGAPFWYNNCMNGAIVGGGETPVVTIYNGAYWSSSHAYYGLDDGTGAGNGWMYIR